MRMLLASSPLPSLRELSMCCRMGNLNLVSDQNQSLHSTELGSGIVSTALQCEDLMCPTDSLNLPVTITIQHSMEVEVRYKSTLLSMVH